jgi:hypothetical protein
MKTDEEVSYKRYVRLVETILKWQDQVKAERGGKHTKSVAEFDWASITALFVENNGKDSSSSSSSGPVIVTEEQVKDCMELWAEICSSLQPERDDSLSPSKGKRKRKTDILRKELDDSDMNPSRIHEKICGTYGKSEGEFSREDSISKRRSKLKSSATCVFPEHYYYDTSIMLLCDPILSTSGPQEPRKKRSLSSQTAASNPLSADLLAE